MRAEAERGHISGALLSAILALALIVRLAIAWAPLEWLLRYVLADDSFYYLTIARNFVDGHGFSFDRIAQTNGFHPLWMIILLPFFAVVHERILSIHLALTLTALIDVASVGVLFMLLRRLGLSIRVITITGTLFAFAPILFSYSGPLNGMETSLNILLIFLFLLSYIRLIKTHDWSLRRVIAFGTITGMLFLARTDNIILIIVTFSYLALSQRKNPARIRYLTGSAIVSLAIASPWLIWSYSNFGSIVQVSGLSVGHMMHEILYNEGWNTLDYGIQCVKNALNWLTYFPVFLYETKVLSLPSFIVAGIGATFGISVLRTYLRSDNGEKTAFLAKGRTLLVPLVAAGLFIVVHTIRAAYLRGWYYSSLTPIALPGLAVILDFWIQERREDPRRTTGKTIAAWLGVAAVYAISLSTLTKTHVGEMDKFTMVQKMNEKLPPGSRVGSWNAGLYGYFFEKGEVVGLDGLVNNDAYSAILERSLGAYCRKVKIRYIVDAKGAMTFAGPFLGDEYREVLRSGILLETVRGAKGQIVLLRTSE